MTNRKGSSANLLVTESSASAVTAPLAGKVALVTGATSGIGAATAIAYAAAGAAVLLTGRNAEGAERTHAAITAASGNDSTSGTAAIALGDITKSSFCDELVDTTVSQFGRIDILANVAGTITRGDATETSDEEWHQNISVNLDAVFFASRAAIRAMRAQGDGGVIVNLASNVGLVGTAGLPAYCASKGAVVLMTKAMAIDHAAEGIRINALCPGSVNTPMLVSGHQKSGRTVEQVFADNIAAIPEGRLPQPDEIAKSMVYLASDMSSHVTGVALPIDGGYVAQ